MVSMEQEVPLVRRVSLVRVSQVSPVLRVSPGSQVSPGLPARQAQQVPLARKDSTDSKESRGPPVRLDLAAALPAQPASQA